MDIAMRPITSMDAIYETFNSTLHSYAFTHLTDGENYIRFATDTQTKEFLEADIAQELEEWGETDLFKQMENDLELINYFRSLGFTEYVLISTERGASNV